MARIYKGKQATNTKEFLIRFKPNYCSDREWNKKSISLQVVYATVVLVVKE
jgi:hypothetical protein